MYFLYNTVNKIIPEQQGAKAPTEQRYSLDPHTCAKMIPNTQIQISNLSAQGAASSEDPVTGLDLWIFKLQIQTPEKP